MLKADAPQSVRLYRLCMFDGPSFTFRVARNLHEITQKKHANCIVKAASLSGNLHAFSSVFGLLVIRMLSAGANNGLRMGMEVGFSQ